VKLRRECFVFTAEGLFVIMLCVYDGICEVVKISYVKEGNLIFKVRY